MYTAISKKVFQSQWSILEPKGTLGVVITTDNATAKVVTVWPWHYGEPAVLQSMLNSNRLFVLLEPHSSFRSQYRLPVLTMTTFFEIAV